jgi:hypothetical protein
MGRSLCPPFVSRRAYGGLFDDLENLLNAPFKLASGNISAPTTELKFNMPTGYQLFFLVFNGLTADGAGQLFLELSADGASYLTGTGLYKNKLSYNTVADDTFVTVEDDFAGSARLPDIDNTSPAALANLTVIVSARYIWQPQMFCSSEPPDISTVDSASKFYFGRSDLQGILGRMRGFRVFPVGCNLVAGSYTLWGWQQNPEGYPIAA